MLEVVTYFAVIEHNLVLQQFLLENLSQTSVAKKIYVRLT